MSQDKLPMYNFTSPPLESDSDSGVSESYASVDIKKPLWLNAFARKKDCSNEPTKVLDKVAFATVRTVRDCEVAKIGVNLRVVLDKFALALDPATILVKADWINEVILLLCMGYRNGKTGFMNFVCWYVTVLRFKNDESPDSLLENEVNT